MSVNCRCLLLGCILLWVAAGTTIANGDEPTTDRQPVPTHSTADEHTPDETPSKTELSEQQRRRIVTAAFYVLGGILFVGLMLIVLTVLWGSRTRRVARKPLPEQSPGDPLWYLRPDKQVGISDAAPPEDTPETGLEQDADETT